VSKTRLNILYVADGRSPIALNWMGYFIEAGHQVHLVSTYPCAPDLHIASLEVLPVAFSSAAGNHISTPDDQAVSVRPSITKIKRLLRRIFPTASARTSFRHWLGPFTLPSGARRLEEIILRIQPDLVHAMRIPYEGMLAALANPTPPLLISIWGNDFTLHAGSNPMMAHYTRRAMKRASALHADCFRDLRLARDWGYDPEQPSIVLPGAGGVQLDIFYPPAQGQRSPIGQPKEGQNAGPPGGQPAVINPRGFRAYVRNDTFFKSIPQVLAARPDLQVVCPAMQGEPQARRWVEELEIAHAVQLLPSQTQAQMAELFRKAHIAVSPTTHDGTPNTLLEAMACGCFPIAGDLESIQEWIVPGLNGLLVDPGDPQALAEAILQAINDPELRERAISQNLLMVKERAEYHLVMQTAEGFYQQLASSF
jgi:glycosyltransferase involved in cell wall biosynthesis